MYFCHGKNTNLSLNTKVREPNSSSFSFGVNCFLLSLLFYLFMCSSFCLVFAICSCGSIDTLNKIIVKTSIKVLYQKNKLLRIFLNTFWRAGHSDIRSSSVQIFRIFGTKSISSIRSFFFGSSSARFLSGTVRVRVLIRNPKLPKNPEKTIQKYPKTLKSIWITRTPRKYPNYPNFCKKRLMCLVNFGFFWILIWISVRIGYYPITELPSP